MMPAINTDDLLTQDTFLISFSSNVSMHSNNGELAIYQGSYQSDLLSPYFVRIASVGSSISRKPSPMRLTEVTYDEIIKLGKRVSHHATDT